MNCFNCGASVSAEHKKCPFCGQSMQIVPDYNFLDDDNINVLMEESVPAEPEKKVDQEAAEKIRQRKKEKLEKEKQRRLEIKKQRQMILVFIAVVVVCGILFTAFFAVSEMIQQQNNNSFDYQVKQAEEAIKDKDYDSAKEYYYKALSLKPDDLDVRFALANMFSLNGMTEDMVAMYKDILKIDAQNYTAYKMLFQHYNSLGDVEAILELRKGVKDDRIMALFQDYAVENPKIYLKGGTYQGAIEVMITAKLEYEIYYTIDGSDPTKNGIRYTGMIRIEKAGMTTLKVASKNAKGVFSNIMQETYYLNYKAPDAPIVKPEGVYMFDSETYLTILVPTGCTAYYAWDIDEKVIDITNPECIRLAYVDGIRIPSGEHKLSLVIIDNTSGMASTVYRQLYTCTLSGIPLPDEFLNHPSEEPSTDDVMTDVPVDEELSPENPEDTNEPEENENPEGNIE